MEKLFLADDARLCARPVTGANGNEIGAGLFARGNFRAGETVFKLDWQDEERTEILSWDDTEEEHHNRCAAIAPRWYFYINDEHPFWYINHSCAPNVAFQNWAQPIEDEYIPLVALRDIQPGEELAFDYSFTIAGDDGLTDEEQYSLQCLCGQPECRGTITSFAALPPALQLREMLRQTPVTGTIPAFILNEIPALVDRLRTEAPHQYELFRAALATQNRLAEEFAEEYDPDEPYFLK